jgi:hypothetical protein
MGNNNFSDFTNLIEKLCSLIKGINSLPEDDNPIVIYHLLILTSSILSNADKDNKLNKNISYLFRTLLQCFYEKILKAIKSKSERISTFVSFFLNIIEKVKQFYSSENILLLNEKGLLNDFVNIMCNLIQQFNPTVINSIEILNVVNKIYEFLEACYGCDFPANEVNVIFETAFNRMDEYMKMNNSIEESALNAAMYKFFECVLCIMYDLSSLRLKDGIEANMFTDDGIRNEKNKKLMIYINSFNKLFSNKNSDEIMKLKWYCLVLFGFLNKGKKVEEEFELIKTSLKKCMEREHSITHNKKEIELTKIAYECL